MQRLLALVALVLVIGACSTAPSGPPAVDNGELTNAADGTRIAIKRGGELKVVLDANITTGYQWQSPTATRRRSCPRSARPFTSAGRGFAVGGGGTNIFRFRADSPGQIALQFDYRRPWRPACRRPGRCATTWSSSNACALPLPQRKLRVEEIFT
jgi:inhibitor of cysteine peptidase